MPSQQLKFAIRSIWKNRINLTLNLFGLITGTLAAFIIAKYVGFSLSYDNFHKKKERIFLIAQKERSDAGIARTTMRTYWGTGALIKNNYPNVESVTQTAALVETLILFENENGDIVKFNENKILSVDSSFMKMFSYNVILGNRKELLCQPNKIVLTASMAEKYFDTKNPLGETLTLKTSWGEETNLTIEGVIQDPPKNSSIQFDFLLSNEQFQRHDYWNRPDYDTYVLLKSEESVDEFSKKLSTEVNRESTLPAQGKTIDFELISLQKIRISTDDYILTVVGIFILIVSWTNFISLFTVQFLAKRKEMGIKTILGATKRNLLRQLFIEAVLVNGIALLLTFTVYAISENYLQSITSGHILPFIKDSIKINLLFLALFLTGTVISSLIPALSVLSQKNLTSSVEDPTEGGLKKLGLRKALVIIQFSITTVLIVSISVIISQLKFMRNQEKGISMSNIVIIKAPKDSWDGKQERLESFKLQCANFDFVESVCSSTTIPGENYRQETLLSPSPNAEKSETVLMYGNGIDDKFMELYDVAFLTGKNFSPDSPWKNKRNIILNESALNVLGITNAAEALGRKFYIVGSDKAYELIGVVKDYHKMSLKSEVKPTAFFFNANRGSFSIKLRNQASINSEEGRIIFNTLQNVWEATYADQPFDHFVLEDLFYTPNLAEENFERFFKVFTILSIIISCLGLYALSLFLAKKRLKEVSLRRIFGARSIEIFAVLLKDYAIQLFLAIIIGIPTAYYLMNSWLTNYSFRITLGFWILPYGVLPLLLIFILTVSYQIIKVTRVNPSKVFREN